MKLIIAEKPSLGRNIANAISGSSFTKHDGYMENKEYIVTWGFGHLFSLKDVEDYLPPLPDNHKYSWILENLPFKPNNFEFALKRDNKTKKVDAAVKKQFETIKRLCKRKDVSCIINAGDADREGEIIIRIILSQIGNQKPVMRLWLPEQTHQTIRESLINLKSDDKYDNLAREGYARTYMDWLYGINLTRYATLKADGRLQKPLRVGRVITPIVKAIYDKDMEIRHFVPEKYWAIVANTTIKGVPLEFVSKTKFPINQKVDAITFANDYNKERHYVSGKQVKETIIKPHKLFSLSTLQGTLGTKYKMTPKESLAIIQELYEQGYVTYPRTNTEYLAVAESNKINAIIDRLKTYGYFVIAKSTSDKSIYDDSKIESHSALTPTGKIGKKEDFTDNQWKVYSTILNRFLAVFCSAPCKVNRTTLTISVGDKELFRKTGDVILEKGWLMYEEGEKQDKILPNLELNEDLSLCFAPVMKETAPPKKYTVKTLNDYMKNPFKTEQNELSDDALDGTAKEQTDNEVYQAILSGIELGTEATRTGIIENAVKSEYISLKNNVYSILPAGEYYIETLLQLNLCLPKENTANLGKILKDVYTNKKTVSDCIELTYAEISNMMTQTKDIEVVTQSPVALNNKTSLGNCPKCGSPVIENNKAFSCSNKNCKFYIWKEDSFIKGALGKKVTPTLVKNLLSKNKCSLKGCISKKTGKKYDCILNADFSGDTVKYSLTF